MQYYIYFKSGLVNSVEVIEGESLQDAIDELLAKTDYTNEDIAHTEYIGDVANVQTESQS